MPAAEHNRQCCALFLRVSTFDYVALAPFLDAVLNPGTEVPSINTIALAAEYSRAHSSPRSTVMRGRIPGAQPQAQASYATSSLHLDPSGVQLSRLGIRHC
jgi:hypothetical protein